MANKVRIGFIGTGGMGQCAHLRNYATLPECEVVALAEIREDVRKKVAARYGIAHVYASHKELLANEKLDGLVSAQPFTRHGTLLPDVLAAGIPLFTEKPLAGSIEMGEKILKALAQGKSWYMVGYHKRSDPATQYAKAEIDKLKASGELGAMKYVRLLMPTGDWIAGGFFDLVRGEGEQPKLEFDPPASDMDKETNDQYISFVNYYIHQVNLMRYLLGETYKVTYAAASGVMFAGQSNSGIACTLEMTPFQTTLDWQESALVCFERGWVKIELPSPLAINRPGKVTLFRDPGKGVVPQTIEPQMPWVHAMRQQAMNFIKAIKGEAKPPCEAAEALEDLKVAREYIRLWKGK